MSTKTCSKCKEVKDLSQFHTSIDRRNNKEVLRYNSYCKPCGLEYRNTTGKAYRDEYNKKNYAEKTEHHKKYSRELARSVRKAGIDLYGGKCAFCGIDDFDVLSIDHIHLGGTKHAKAAGGCISMYREIISEYKPDLYRVLCYNCNCGKRLHEPKERNRRQRNDRNYLQRKRLNVLTMYGDSCVCCGIKDFEVLTLDHINNDGKADRMLHGAGSSFIKYLSKIPKRNDLQLLCWNCNRKKELMNRIPVYHKDGTRISNTTEARARKLIKNKQAVAVENASTFSIKMIVDTRKN